MTPDIFTPEPPVTAAIRGEARPFMVRRLFCVGRNYAAHAREMGKDPTREPPFFFTKWASTVVKGGGTIAYPPATSDYHHEIELVVAIAGSGASVPAERAMDLVYGYAVGLDMTRRDLQSQAKELGRPWDVAKNVPQSAPLGVITRRAEAGAIETAAIRLEVNGKLRQEGRIADMIWPVAGIIAFISGFYRLLPGDLIYTGTPSGVGPVRPGDRLTGTIDGLEPLSVTIGPPEA